MTAQSEHQKNQKLKHVKVYNRIYERMQNGIYPPGSQLPSESALAEEMGVSRMTLRKALALFIEDGLLRNVPGVGHFVREPNSRASTFLDKSTRCNPVYAYASTVSESCEFEFRMEAPTQSILDTLEQYTPAVVITDRWYHSNALPFAYSLSFLPIESIAGKQIDLNRPEELLRYLEEDCYKDMSYCHRICSHTTTGNFTAKKTLSAQDSFLLIQETIYDKNDVVLVSSKHYIPSDLYRIKIEIS